MTLPNKGAQGQPSQYYVDRQTTPTITLYLTPDASTYTHLCYYTLNRIEDAGAYTNNPDIPFRFLPCMISGLAFYLSLKYAPERTQALKLYYEDELKEHLMKMVKELLYLFHQLIIIQRGTNGKICKR